MTSGSEAPPPTAGGSRVGRRGLLLAVGVAANALAAALVGVPVIGFLLAPLRRMGRQAWVSLGTLADFPVGQTRLATYRAPFARASDGATADTACWVRRADAARFQVFAVNCAHLGCPVRWFPQSGLFMCPCHGGVYYADGSRASGPPPRGLYEYDAKVEDGRLWIRAGELPTPSQPA